MVMLCYGRCRCYIMAKMYLLDAYIVTHWVFMQDTYSPLDYVSMPLVYFVIILCKYTK